MAHKHAAIKHLRHTEKRTEKNASVKKNIAYLRKQALRAVGAKDSKTAEEFFKKMTKAVDKAARVNIIKKNTAARKKSRLATAINEIVATKNPAYDPYPV